MKYENVVNFLNGSIWASDENQLMAVLSMAETIASGSDAVKVRGDRYRKSAEQKLEVHTGGAQVRLTDKGTAIVPIMGVISPKANMFMSWSGGTSSMSLRNVARTLAKDGRVKRVVLHVDSGGGAALGVPEAAHELLKLRAVKPVIAVINGVGASGAYWLASTAHKIVVEPSSIVGSVGVFQIAMTAAEKYAKDGIDVRVIRKGALKYTPNSVEPFTDAGLQRAQDEVDRVYATFVTAIKENRNITMSKAEALADGTVETGQAAVDRGFADEVGTYESVVESADSGDYDSLASTPAGKVLSALGADSPDTLVDTTPVAEAVDPTQAALESARMELEVAHAAKEQALAEAAEIRKQVEAEKIETVIATAVADGRIAPKNVEDARATALEIGYENFSKVIGLVRIPEPMEVLSTAVQPVEQGPVDTNAPKTEEQKALMARFPSLKKRYNL